jgi:crotonobetainyl-CoA:carnitine CoA-transferase CaiB-like acyl-CoA transferase
VYRRIDRTLTHPQTEALGILHEVKSDGTVRKVRRFPARFSKLRLKPLQGAPKLGEHTRQIAAELGLSADELDELLR